MKNTHYSDQFFQRLPAGAFLTVSDQGRHNTMTIGWGALGFIWGKPIVMVAVRKSRHTYKFMESTESFTVSIPLTPDLKRELAGAGSTSGRDIDKFAVYNLQAKSGLKVPVPVIEQCDLFYECRIVYKQAMDPEHLDESIKASYYQQGDYHVLFFGEILASYMK